MEFQHPTSMSHQIVPPETFETVGRRNSSLEKSVSPFLQHPGKGSNGIKAVFLDKDGTLIEDVPYNVNPDKIKLCKGAIAALKKIYSAGYQLFIITNQSGVARGYFPEEALLTVEQHLKTVFLEAGIPIVGFYYCPHHPDGMIAEYAIACDCRKPAPGLLLKAAQEHSIDLENSWFIGDILNDVEAGRKAGCRTILIDNGNETEWQLSYARLPHHVVTNLADAAQVIGGLGAIASTAANLQQSEKIELAEIPMSDSS